MPSWGIAQADRLSACSVLGTQLYVGDTPTPRMNDEGPTCTKQDRTFFSLSTMTQGCHIGRSGSRQCLAGATHSGGSPSRPKVDTHMHSFRAAGDCASKMQGCVRLLAISHDDCEPVARHHEATQHHSLATQPAQRDDGTSDASHAYAETHKTCIMQPHRSRTVAPSRPST